jgi:methyl-accepting chemotaxis protein
MDSGMKTVSEQGENIRSAMEEHDAGSKQILAAIGELNEATQIVKDGSRYMFEGSTSGNPGEQEPGNSNPGDNDRDK